MTHCQFFIKRKKRYCKMIVKKGNMYCGEHQEVSLELLEPNNCEKSISQPRRIQCPLDKSHTCYESRLKQHLKVCNVKQLIDRKPEYIIDGINKGSTINIPKHIPLCNLEQNIIDNVISKVEKAYDMLPQVEELIYEHEILKDEINNPTYGNHIKKHLIQNASLLSHLKYAGLVKDDTCFIEFGAGKGKLTYWLAQIIKDIEKPTILLVDRSSHRYKKDNKLKNEKCPINIIRIRADIADLALHKIEDVKNSTHKVGIAKHLCGAATDLMINCLCKLSKEDSTGTIGLIIAFCCHHRCEYNSYVGKSYLEACGFEPEDFPILSSIASWATCGSKNDQKLNTSTKINDTSQLEKRESIGRKVKLILNWGRVKYLTEIGFNCNLYFYTKLEVSPENMCVVAIRK
ncbi:tRNA:m(4)X modification enzyme TRM13 homolog [Chelonus insularis]|uniref:tRNA:m(4)X modification enzyme TRM13 homolog n=1 Tax=Chelonus insularis TaxID=460826 RepID=UPI00158B057E|nr:tRNA:m(4)X modification enzyme TRM13 homolog [Chelonus insularis]